VRRHPGSATRRSARRPGRRECSVDRVRAVLLGCGSSSSPSRRGHRREIAAITDRAYMLYEERLLELYLSHVWDNRVLRQWTTRRVQRCPPANDGLAATSGPDDEGAYIDSHMALGVRRLSVIDLETGRQRSPTKTTRCMWCSTGRSTISPSCAAPRVEVTRFGRIRMPRSSSTPTRRQATPSLPN